MVMAGWRTISMGEKSSFKVRLLQAHEEYAVVACTEHRHSQAEMIGIAHVGGQRTASYGQLESRHVIAFGILAREVETMVWKTLVVTTGMDKSGIVERRIVLKSLYHSFKALSIVVQIIVGKSIMSLLPRDRATLRFTLLPRV